jgi:hypothetical protein
MSINEAVKVHAEMQKTESDFIFEKRLIEEISDFFSFDFWILSLVFSFLPACFSVMFSVSFDILYHARSKQWNYLGQHIGHEIFHRFLASGQGAVLSCSLAWGLFFLLALSMSGMTFGMTEGMSIGIITGIMGFIMASMPGTYLTIFIIA